MRVVLHMIVTVCVEVTLQSFEFACARCIQCCSDFKKNYPCFLIFSIIFKITHTFKNSNQPSDRLAARGPPRRPRQEEPRVHGRVLHAPAAARGAHSGWGRAHHTEATLGQSAQSGTCVHAYVLVCVCAWGKCVRVPTESK